jgi:hypothetical protein
LFVTYSYNDLVKNFKTYLDLYRIEINFVGEVDGILSFALAFTGMFVILADLGFST